MKLRAVVRLVFSFFLDENCTIWTYLLADAAGNASIAGFNRRRAVNSQNLRPTNTFLGAFFYTQTATLA